MQLRTNIQSKRSGEIRVISLVFPFKIINVIVVIVRAVAFAVTHIS